VCRCDMESSAAHYLGVIKRKNEIEEEQDSHRGAEIQSLELQHKISELRTGLR